jgi:hypothetical protein|tara:strand:+ start:290 stop:496 length:207 start_codon:yes stop_codon:yes gene_type:complete
VIFTKEDQEKEDLWAAQKKYYAARSVWRKRFQEVPSGRHGKTWGQWFEKMFGENLEAYAKRMAKEKPG